MQKVYFRYPYDAPLKSLEINRPVFGNSHNANMQVMIKHSRNGTTYSYSREPKYETLTLQFKYLSECDAYAEKNAIIDFFKDASGDEFLYADHEGYYWRALLITTNIKLTYQGLGDSWGFSLDLEVRDKQPYSNPSDTILSNVSYLISRSGDYIDDVNGRLITTTPERG